MEYICGLGAGSHVTSLSCYCNVILSVHCRLCADSRWLVRESDSLVNTANCSGYNNYKKIAVKNI